MIGIVAICLSSYLSASPVSSSGPTSRPSKSILKVDVVVLNEKPQWEVGDSIEIQANLSCVSTQPALIGDWSKERYFQKYWTYFVDVINIPFETKVPEGHIPGRHYGHSWPAPPKECFRLLDSNSSIPPRSHKICAMIPGKLQICVMFSSDGRYHYYDSDGRSEGKSMPGAWIGDVRGEIILHISDKIPAKIDERYKNLSKTLGDRTIPLPKRLSLLAEVANEKHYFAAQFVHNVWNDSTDAGVKLAALEHLIGLLEFGSAYRAFPDILDVLRNQETPEKYRFQILKFIGENQLLDETPSFVVAEHSSYFLPKEIAQKTRDIVKTLSVGRNPLLALEAQKIINDIRR